MKEEILSIKNGSVGYGKTAVVEGIDIGVEKGSVHVLLGPNGCGKSTLLRTVTGHLPLLGGELQFMNKPLALYQKKELAKKMAVILTQRVDPGLMTGWDVVSMGRYPYTDFMGRLGKEDREIVDQIIEETGISRLASRYFDTLSDGEKQKILFARALAQQPELIVLDEPTSYLDINYKVEMLSTLRELASKNGVTVLMSLHEVDLAAKFADDVTILHAHKVEVSGKAEDVVTEENIDRVYQLRHCAFSAALGGVELLNRGCKTAFVLAGEATSAETFRLLNKQGYRVISSPLKAGDGDYLIAEVMGIRILSEEEFADEEFMISLLTNCDQIIYQNKKDTRGQRRLQALLENSAAAV